MAPKVLFDLFSPVDDGPENAKFTYMPQETLQTGDGEIIPPPPKAASGVHIPKK